MAMPLSPRNVPPFDAARVHSFLEHGKSATREHRAELGRQRRGHGFLEIDADLFGRALGGLQRDVAGKALDHHHVGRRVPDLIAFDEADIFGADVDLLQPAVRFPDLVDALDLLDADIEQPDARPLVAKQRPATWPPPSARNRRAGVRSRRCWRRRRARRRGA